MIIELRQRIERIANGALAVVRADDDADARPFRIGGKRDLGEYVAQLVTTGGVVEPRFTLATKKTVQKRSVY